MLRNPQQEAAERSVLELMAKDPPGTKYVLTSSYVWLGENKVKILLVSVLPERSLT